jgi:HK97 gp10 family phage protein
MGDGIDFSSTYKFNVDGSAAMEIARAKMGAKMKEKAERILDAAKDNAPVDTGALRDSGHIEEEKENLVYQIIFDAPVLNGSGSYARYVEEGTSKMDAQSYLRPAILAAKD